MKSYQAFVIRKSAHKGPFTQDGPMAVNEYSDLKTLTFQAQNRPEAQKVLSIYLAGKGIFPASDSHHIILI